MIFLNLSSLHIAAHRLMRRKIYWRLLKLKRRTIPRDQLVEKVCALVKEYGLEEKIIFPSIPESNLIKAKRLSPKVPRRLLTFRGRKGAWVRSLGSTLGDYPALHLHPTKVMIQQVARAHRPKGPICVWTLNKTEDMLRLKHWDGDGIYTDDPHAALCALGSSA